MLACKAFAWQMCVMNKSARRRRNAPLQWKEEDFRRRRSGKKKPFYFYNTEKKRERKKALLIRIDAKKYSTRMDRVTLVVKGLYFFFKFINRIKFPGFFSSSLKIRFKRED
jgi:hypothetical protein